VRFGNKNIFSHFGKWSSLLKYFKAEAKRSIGRAAMAGNGCDDMKRKPSFSIEDILSPNFGSHNFASPAQNPEPRGDPSREQSVKKPADQVPILP
jgi:hypothetical protein